MPLHIRAQGVSQGVYTVEHSQRRDEDPSVN